jgi:beta-glucosidase
MANSTDLKAKIKDLISQMTLEEKAGLLSGFDYWHTKSLDRLGIPKLSMADGPHGLRKQRKNELGIDKSYPATCFPPAALLACSWDEELAQKQGEAIGKEARAAGLSCVLGPGINIKRSPLCGRNFEYFSEDPLLSGRMGAGVVNGIQSTGVSACVKHFAANNQEDYRFWVDVKVDERTLREIYLASFEYALMYSEPKAMMCSYNKINGVYSSENRRLLTEVLRNDWKYDGIVMADWGAVNNRPQGVWAGLDLEMPGSYGVNDAEIVKAVKGEEVYMESSDTEFANTLTEREVDVCVERMLNWILQLESTTVPADADFTEEEHHQTARDIASECMVLLENEGVLPFKKGINVAVVGDMAIHPVYQGAGSSRIVPTKVDSPLDCISEYANVTYIKGSSSLNKRDLDIIKESDAVIVFAGTPDKFDAEGCDRQSMRLPESQYRLVKEVWKANEKTVTVVCAGAPVDLPYSPALLMAYYGGQAMGGAVADLLFGVKNPCGKLAETFFSYIEDTPAFLNFPGDGASVVYGEGVNVGYRWCVKRNYSPAPQYAFGDGLSYTKFDYSELKKKFDAKNIPSEVSVKVTNIGDYDGKEIVQLYINGELKGFKKIFLKKGESQVVTLELTPRSFSYWNVRYGKWFIKGGAYEIKAGGRLGAFYYDDGVYDSVMLECTGPIPRITMYTQVRKLYDVPNCMDLLNEIGEQFGVEITEDVVNVRDCSSFFSNMLRNMVTMFPTGWTFAELQGKIDRINTLNGLQ